MESKGINDLPIELYKSIFRNLSIKDLLNCRSVNKKFKFLTYECINKLVINELDKSENDYWFDNNVLIDDDYLINLECFKQIRLRFNLNIYLKYLKINIKKDDYDVFKKEFSNFNYLINLKYLEINSSDLDFKLVINLKNLKYFKLNINNLTHTCELKAPKLKKIEFLNKSQNIPQISIQNPESTNHLIIDDFEDKLKVFENAEIVEFRNVSNLNENILSFFKNLKQLKIEKKGIINESLEKCLTEILEKSINIDIYLCGVKLINKDKIKECKFDSTIFSLNYLEFQLNNYDLLDSNLKNVDLDYIELNNYYENLKNDLPSNFFDKYQNVSNIHFDSQFFVSKLNNPMNIDVLSWFINNIKCLKKIAIFYITNQRFYNNLPITLNFLNIVDLSGKSKYSNINFNFILKLNKLIEFKILGISVDLFDLVLTSFANLKYLKKFLFYYKENFIEIDKENRSTFNLKINEDESIIVNLDYDQLKEELNKIRLN